MVAGIERPSPNWWAVLGLAVIALVAERGSIRLSHTTESSIALLPTLLAAVLFGPFAAMLVAAASQLGDFRRPYMKWATYTSIRAITGAATGASAALVMAIASDRIAGVVVATMLCAATAEILDVAFTAVTHRVRRNGDMVDIVRLLGPLVAASIPLYTPVVALLAIAYAELSPWTLPLFAVPALAAQRLFLLYREQRSLTEELIDANARLERANLSFATALVATLDARDRYTAGHSAAVAVYARDIAERMGLSEDDQRHAHLCGLVHDIGKVGLTPGLLEKPGPLTLDERRQMEEHSAIGERILANVEDYAETAAVVRHHHERVDGHGYPDRLQGSAIPLLSRIIAVADSYDAMTSDRPYRDAMPSRVARLRLAQAVESQFDTSVVAAFEAILAGASEDYRSGKSPQFSFSKRAAAAINAEPRLVASVAL
ncbi:MAG: HD domain-containing protein [Actinomycetota bacterium]|nr:HD domain-containing protein [Actinomycetota bacterium]